MILSGEEIKSQLGSNILIDPFDEKQLNPNSYNLRLHDELIVYEEIVLDVRRPNRYRRHIIPPEGFVLEPHKLYVGRTVERTETHNLVPMLEGRCSIARLGLFVHASPGFGDVGFSGYWTLELVAVHPIRIYAGLPICQIIYHTMLGAVAESRTNGLHQNNQDFNLMFKELQQPPKDLQMRLAFGQELAE